MRIWRHFSILSNQYYEHACIDICRVVLCQYVKGHYHATATTRSARGILKMKSRVGRAVLHLIPDGEYND